MKTWAALFFVLLATLAALSWYVRSQQAVPQPEGEFQVYQSGTGLELSLELATIANVNDGLVRFVNQERFSERKTQKELGIRYHIRRLEGRADCNARQYAFIGASYWTASGQHVYTQMFPLQRFNWTFVPVVADSTADTMLRLVCQLAPNAPSLKIE
ncbi:hypothetical protein ACFSQE_06010 [Vogesella fluminis]|uniref:CNP1-like uncharacterized domain-containing protein n=1 Tax=Vogesella fluminis TaxID=1069161 RepID=A0ABQ3HBD5_9NEIS|nr:hypothetical protein [Vogesella fluminis]GHD78122.1 hypothetical protein GCM10011419_19730 [Vogesella fluminis]